MRTLAVVLLYVVGALFLGALLSYPLYLLLEPIGDVRFHRIVSRTGLLVAVLGFPLLVMYLRVDSRQALGFDLSARAFINRFSGGWLLGLLTLLPLIGALLAFGVRVPAPGPTLSWSEVLQVAARGAVSGLLVGFIEETFFRGAVYGAIARRHSVAQAIVFASLLYALLHFPKPLPVSPEGLFWASGVITLGQGYRAFADPMGMADSFLALFTAGLLLALVRRYSGHLAYCIGLHAGWVMVIKLARHFTDRNPDSFLAYLVGNYDGITGHLAAAWIGTLCLAYVVMVGRRSHVVGRRS